MAMKVSHPCDDPHYFLGIHGEKACRTVNKLSVPQRVRSDDCVQTGIHIGVLDTSFSGYADEIFPRIDDPLQWHIRAQFLCVASEPRQHLASYDGCGDQ